MRTLKMFLGALALLSIGQGAMASESMSSQYLNSPELLSQRYDIQPFSTLDIAGPVHVNLTGSQSHYGVRLVGDGSSLAQTQVREKDGVLWILPVPNAKGYIGNVTAEITVPDIQMLRYHGTRGVNAEKLSGLLNIYAGGQGNIEVNGDQIDLRQLKASDSVNINVNGLKSQLLYIQDDSSGDVNLMGTMVLQQILFQSPGTLSMRWIDSTHVRVISSGKGQIFLAGIAGMLEANVAGQSFLNARYLRAKKGVINTSEYARANVYTENVLDALASGGSEIYYYNDPTYAGGYMRTRGSVFRMEGVK